MTGMKIWIETTRLRGAAALVALATFACAGIGCGRKEAAQAPATPPTAPTETSVAASAGSGAAEADAPPEMPAYEAALPAEVRDRLLQPFTGDLDQMIARRLIRVGVAANRTFYFVDRGVQRGAAYEMGVAFEDYLNKKLEIPPAKKVNVVFVPLPRDQMGAALTSGRVDLVVAQVIVRPELQAIVDFTDPVRENVREIVVSAPGAPAIATVDDLSGRDVYARRQSSAWESLAELNQRLEKAGREPVAVHEVPGNLEDDDLLEMTNAGIVPLVVVQDYLAEFWSKIFTQLQVHDTVALRTGATIAVPVRKNSPKLLAELNAFGAKNGLGTAFGNIVNKRYLVNTSYAKQATSEAERRKFLEMAEFFKKYSDQYSLDYLLMAAQGYQESGLDQNAKSHVGAIGVMQVMPATGKELAVGDISQIEPNIHAGVKYIRFMMDRYYKDEPMDNLNRGLFTFASYNAGPARIRQLRKEAEKRGLDPNVWFGNVEQIASERIGRETVSYVSNIYKYYVAYKLMLEDRAHRAQSKEAVQAGRK
jgi:membrane-bound lytic murein transglycosylase MltF